MLVTFGAIWARKAAKSSSRSQGIRSSGVARRFAPTSVQPVRSASVKSACTGLACTIVAAAIGLLALFMPASAIAQTNLDQGKSASQIFASDCAECHKGARGLAKGRSSASLTDFLREHYTTSREQAAALAAYVLGGRDSNAGGPGSFTPGQKPPTDRAGGGLDGCGCYGIDEQIS